MKEKQITMPISRLNDIVNHAVNAVLFMSGDKDIAASTVHACMIG